MSSAASMSELRVHILAVGGADAIVLELPSGRLGVIDFGHALLLHYLQELDPTRARRYAFCLLTHAHSDHYACLGAFLDRHDTQVEQYWLSFSDPGSIPELLMLKAKAFQQDRKRLRLMVQLAGHPLAPMPLDEPGVEVWAFRPNEAEFSKAPTSQSENDRSVVLLIRYGGAGVLLGADAGATRWRRIIEEAQSAHLPLAAHLFKAPHHGAKAPEGFPQDLWSTVLVGPQSFAAFSVGRERERPHRGVIEAARLYGQIRCTGRAATCRPLAPAPPSHPPTHLYELALAPPPEEKPAPPCFGTQIYQVDAAGRITAAFAMPSPPLDACVSTGAHPGRSEGDDMWPAGTSFS
jgi:beta-lactamase superfamily II metal-dependent hydrolase